MDAITLKELLDGLQVIAVACGSVMAILAFMHYAMVRPMKSFLEKEIVTHLVDINHSIQANTTQLEAVEDKLNDHISNGGHVHTDGGVGGHSHGHQVPEG